MSGAHASSHHLRAASCRLIHEFRFSILWGHKHAGAKTEQIAKDYGLDRNIIEQALTHFGMRKKRHEECILFLDEGFSAESVAVRLRTAGLTVQRFPE